MHTHHVHHTHTHHLPLLDYSSKRATLAPLWSAVTHKMSHLAHELERGIRKSAILGPSKRGKHKGGGPPWSGPPGVPWGFPPMY